MANNLSYDAVIIGGGAVGTSLAVAMVQQGYSVALVDSLPPEQRTRPETDNRVFALAAGTKAVLEQLGVWSYMQAKARPIEHIHVSNKGSFGAARLHASDFSLGALGYMLAAADMQAALNQAVADLAQQTTAKLDLYYPASFVDFEQMDNGWVAANIQQQEPDGQEPKCLTLISPLLIAADGACSAIRSQLHIQSQQKHYDQKALVALIKLEREHQNIAYERFIKESAIALLPYHDQHSVLIWSLPNEQADRLSAFDEQQFLQELQLTFGHRLGRFQGLSQRLTYPLIEAKAERLCNPQNNIVLVGNAAQSLHPIAAQGFNLALRQIALLVSLLKKYTNNPQKALREFEVLQKPDTQNTLRFTNFLVQFFSDERMLTQSKLLRGSLITAFDVCPPIRRYLLKGVMKGADSNRVAIG